MSPKFPSAIISRLSIKAGSCLLGLITGFHASAQEGWDKGQLLLEQIIEEITADSKTETDFEILYEDLSLLYQQPLDVNTASKEELEKLHVLNDFQIYSLIQYRRETGPLLSPYEIMLVPGFSKELAENIQPFITTEAQKKAPPVSAGEAIKYGRHKLFLRSQRVIEKQAGYQAVSDSMRNSRPNSYYLGNPWKFYSKYRFHHKKRIFAGITMEKDPGEPFFRKNNTRGFDYYSAYFQLNDLGVIKKLVAGDYELNFGQGLTLWSGFGMGKSTSVLHTNKTSQGIRRYTSTRENNFFRGLASTAELGAFELTAFYSLKPMDANIERYDTLTGEVYSVSSLQNTGYHYTPNSVFDEDAIREQVAGGNITFTHNSFQTGVSLYNSRYNAKIERNTSLYNRFEHFSHNNSYGGIDYQYYIADFYFFGEAAFNRRGNHALLSGAIFRMHSQISLSALYRDYSREYYNLYSNGFAESTANTNERGLYLGTEIYPLEKWKISAYADAFRFPWLTYRVDAPSSGYEALAQVDYKVSGQLSMYWKIKHETKQQNASVGRVDSLNSSRIPISDVRKTNLRYHIAYKVSESWSFRNRIEITRYQKEHEGTKNGYLLYQDIIFRKEKLPFYAYFRFGLFDTDDYDSRIYAYENDILHVFSVPAYFSKGIRTYLALKYEISETFDFWFKIGHTNYSDRETVGTGLNEINGNTRTTVKGQLIIRL